jgi:isochorismate pyruvate lyase
MASGRVYSGVVVSQETKCIARRTNSPGIAVFRERRFRRSSGDFAVRHPLMPVARRAISPSTRPPARSYARAMSIRRVFTGAEWEKKIGYCRAVANGPFVAISGTAPVRPEGGTHAPGDAFAQATRCLEIIDGALRELGLDRAAVIRTRMFVTDIARWAEYGRAHAAYFGDTPPATSMVEVRALIAPDMLIEIEADAIAPGGAS